MNEYDFHNNLRKILSKNHSMNQNDIRTQIKSVSKQQFDKKRQEAKNKLEFQEKKYNCLYNYKRMIKKYNYNLSVMAKLASENKKILQNLNMYASILKKGQTINSINDMLSNFRNIMIFLYDIDNETLQRIINRNSF